MPYNRKWWKISLCPPRSLAQLRAFQEASTSHQSAAELGAHALAAVHGAGRTASRRLDASASSTQLRSGDARRSNRPSSSTSDGFWDVKGDIATISDRLPTAPAAMTNIDPSHMNYWPCAYHRHTYVPKYDPRWDEKTRGESSKKRLFATSMGGND